MTEAGGAERGKRPPTEFLQSTTWQGAALLGWLLAWGGADFLLGRMGAGGSAKLTWFLVSSGAIYLVAFARWREECFQLLTSVRFAILQVAALALVLLGSRTLRPGPPSLEANLPEWPLLPHGLGFHAQLSLVALSMLLVAWKRRPYPAHRIGFLLVHLSFPLMLLGGWWDCFRSVQAVQVLGVGETAQRFERLDGAGAFELPGFRLRLEQIQAEPPRAEYRIFADVQPDGKGRFQGAPASFEGRQGSGARLPLAGLRFQVEEVLTNPVDAGDYAENPNGAANPALRILLGIGTGQPLVGDLFSRRPGAARRDEPGGRFAVVYQERWSPDLLDRLRPAPPSSEKLVAQYRGRTLAHAAGLGAAWDLAGIRLRVEKYYPDFAVKKDAAGNPVAYTRSQDPSDPWLELRLEDSRGGSRRVMLSARQPEVSDRLNEANLPPGLRLRYLREGEERQSTFVVLTRQDASIRLVDQGRLARTAPLRMGQPFIVRPGLSVTPMAALDHAEYVPAFLPNPGRRDNPEFHPVAKVRVWDPGNGRSEEKWLDSKGPEGTPVAGTFFDGMVRLAYRPREQGPILHSALAVLDDQGQERTRKTLGPGDPLVLGGIRIYQEPADPSHPESVRFRLARHPGKGLQLSGLVLLVAGAGWMFYLKPVLKSKSPKAPDSKTREEA